MRKKTSKEFIARYGEIVVHSVPTPDGSDLSHRTTRKSIPALARPGMVAHDPDGSGDLTIIDRMDEEFAVLRYPDNHTDVFRWEQISLIDPKPDPAYLGTAKVRPGDALGGKPGQVLSLAVRMAVVIDDLLGLEGAANTEEAKFFGDMAEHIKEMYLQLWERVGRAYLESDELDEESEVERG